MGAAATVKRSGPKPSVEAIAFLLEVGCLHFSVIGNQGIRVPEGSEEGSVRAAAFRYSHSHNPRRAKRPAAFQVFGRRNTPQ
ncbi:hypothetical protein SAMN05444162_4070 [Paenibacillaceae bacterium GAS479]|nr:hypothetical protein SAMN05444162_4070 [Paenibacillaceae bacterium GAS479]